MYPACIDGADIPSWTFHDCMSSMWGAQIRVRGICKPWHGLDIQSTASDRVAGGIVFWHRLCIAAVSRNMRCLLISGARLPAHGGHGELC